MFGDNICGNISAPTSLSYASASLSILIALTSIAGNLLVILAVLVDPNKDLRSPFNYFVINLAFADLIVGCVVAPISAIFHTYEGLGVRMIVPIKVLHLTFFITCTASLLSLAALTVDRYLAITSPLEYRTKLSTSRVIIASVAIWIFAVGFSFIYLKSGYILYTFVFAHTTIVFTFMVLLFTYLKIFSSFRSQVQHWENLAETTEENQASQRAMKWEKKITKTFLIVLALFMACYVPSCIFVYIMNLCTRCSCVLVHVSRDLQIMFVMANSSMNPFVYGWRLENYRRAFKRILTCRWFVRKIRSLSRSVLSIGERQDSSS
ncbi:5-hydroxytryptamine receptor 2B-like [Actinia tenebrosa]|uniref:5-hydroxytryptamine receptor 2B-like n=1 Tax=Actinia tenebrosa TaxID=6105 RepID=A0A6P8IGH3_ACTTE|nr:5-hydroxytryptamine receptor 2B-like [Actinia tenebrosa]XP_031565873.1 5-hydroxytryptamine receptor 2B-like [Actinia tenebrosa]